MSSPKNLNRDMLWTLHGSTPRVDFANADPSDNNLQVNTPPEVFQTHGFVNMNAITPPGQSSTYAAALAMLQPLRENTPYRIHGFSTQLCLFGYGFLNFTGIAAVCYDVKWFHMGVNIDKVVCLPPQNGPQGDNDQAVGFVIATNTDQNTAAGLSVQRMIGQPDRYGSSVS